MEYKVEVNKVTFEELKATDDRKKLFTIAASAKVVINEPAFDQAIGDMLQELLTEICSPAITDNEANLKRRAINILGLLKNKMQNFAECENEYKTDVLEAEEVIK
jgi:hypothetical protein